jgi:hypothetical protein
VLNIMDEAMKPTMDNLADGGIPSGKSPLVPRHSIQQLRDSNHIETRNNNIGINNSHANRDQLSKTDVDAADASATSIPVIGGDNQSSMIRRPNTTPKGLYVGQANSMMRPKSSNLPQKIMGSNMKNSAEIWTLDDEVGTSRTSSGCLYDRDTIQDYMYVHTLSLYV